MKKSAFYILRARRLWMLKTRALAVRPYHSTGRSPTRPVLTSVDAVFEAFKISITESNAAR